MSESFPDSSGDIPSALLREIDRLFCSGKHHGPYRRFNNEVEVVLPGILYRIPVTDRSLSEFALHVYCELQGTGGYLWEREVRSLLRISTLGHPALPGIIDGGYDENANLAFIVTQSTEYDLGHPDGIPLLKSRPADTMRQFSLLCDALSLLHGQGIMHRNLTPRAIQYVKEDSGGNDLRFSLRLGRFEMSALVSNLLRRVSQGEEEIDGQVGKLWLNHHRRERPYFAPERLGYLAPDAGAPMIDTDRSDVYGLGVLAWELFVGEFPEDLLKKTDRVAEGDVEWADELRAHMLGEMRRSGTPRHLRDLIEGMLVKEQGARLQSGEVVQALTQDYTAFTAYAGDPEARKPYLLAFQPKESAHTLPHWGWIDNDPNSEEGREEMIRFLEKDELSAPELLYHAQGANIPAVSGKNKDAKQEAQYVLVGKRGVWFCKKPDIYGLDEKLQETCDDCLLIRFPAPRERAREIAEIEYRRMVPALEVVPWDNKALLANMREGRPSWQPLLDSVEVTTTKPDWRLNWEHAIDWLMEFQEVKLSAREYPYVVVSDESASPHYKKLQYDRERDTRRIDKFRTKLHRASAMLKRYSWAEADPGDWPSASRIPSRFRGTFGDFVEDIDHEELWFEVCPDKNGYPDWRESAGKAEFLRRLDDDHIRIRQREGHIPTRGWLRPRDDRGSSVLLGRQHWAREEFLANGALLKQLDNPSSIRGIRHRWRKAGRNLSNEGGAVDCIKDMLAAQAFYALHGPPGTGKTTITAHAIEAFLRMEPYARILVSAQSNYALDNLALKVQRQLDSSRLDALAIRVKTAGADDEKIDPQIKRLTLEEMAVTTVKRIQNHCAARIEQKSDPDAILRILGEWKAAAASGQVEISERLRNGANIIYCTCNSATEQNVSATGQFGMFDWVIVEEAAKAWPTELSLPLVRGTRWTLIGDHKQLSAFQRDEVDRFLQACASSKSKELKDHGERRTDFAKVFGFFGHLFEDRQKSSSEGSAPGSRPVGALTRQFRMRAPIAKVISEAFYGGTLESDPVTEVDSGLVAPRALAGQALVWLDTGEVCKDELSRNCGEAELVSRLLHRMRFEATEDNQLRDCIGPKLAEGKRYTIAELLEKQSRREGIRDEFLAVLSPYARQVAETLPGASLPVGCNPHCLHTVDAFQGREADVVVVSMVRDQKRGAHPSKSIGFLTEPERINVLLSRAKRLLVIVGKFNHFRDNGGSFWPVVCEEVEKGGRVIPALEVLGD